MANGIAAPEARIMVTVLGLTADDVHVTDTRRTGSTTDLVRVEFGDVHLAGDLRTVQQVVARAADGLAKVERARIGPDQ